MHDYEYFVGVYVFLIFVNSSKILVITYYCNILSYCLFIVVVLNKICLVHTSYFTFVPLLL